MKTLLLFALLPLVATAQPVAEDTADLYARWRDRIVQVISNLLGNALKFTPRGGTITLRVVRDGSQIHFEVQDTGQGIPPEQVPFMFDRFWHGQTRNNGAGLGLFIARGIIAAHGSDLRVETKLGVGSRFFFKLPELVS